MKRITIITIILLNFLGAFAQKESSTKTAAEKVLFLIVYDNDSIYITDRDVTSVTSYKNVYDYHNVNSVISYIPLQYEPSEEPIKSIDPTEWEPDEVRNYHLTAEKFNQLYSICVEMGHSFNFFDQYEHGRWDSSIHILRPWDDFIISDGLIFLFCTPPDATTDNYWRCAKIVCPAGDAGSFTIIRQ